MWDFVGQQRGRLWLEYLPAYAPELNPVEYLWSHWKQHELPNFCPTTFGQLSHHARRALRRMRRRPTLVFAGTIQAFVGHMSTRMLTHYTHITSGAARKAVELLDADSILAPALANEERATVN